MGFLSALGAGLKGVASWLVPSVLSAGGQLAANQSAKRMAERQMAFQREMSDTAVQRGQKDLIAAGLNPALGYGYSAGTPSGVSAPVGDVIGAGVSSAQAARTTQMNLKIMQEQYKAANAAARKANDEAMMTAVDRALKLNSAAPDRSGKSLLQRNYEARLQSEIDSAPLTVQALRAQILAQQYDNVGRSVQADFEKRMGDLQRKGGFLSQTISTAKILSQIFGGLKK